MLQVVAVIEVQAGIPIEAHQQPDPLARRDQDGVFPAVVHVAVPDGFPAGGQLRQHLPLQHLELHSVDVQRMGHAHPAGGSGLRASPRLGPVAARVPWLSRLGYGIVPTRAPRPEPRDPTGEANFDDSRGTQAQGEQANGMRMESAIRGYQSRPLAATTANKPEARARERREDGEFEEVPWRKGRGSTGSAGRGAARPMSTPPRRRRGRAQKQCSPPSPAVPDVSREVSTRNGGSCRQQDRTASRPAPRRYSSKDRPRRSSRRRRRKQDRGSPAHSGRQRPERVQERQQ
jgi:hypothetical protein